MLLVIDVGNTTIVYGVYKDNELVHDFRISTDKIRTSDEYGLIFMNSLTHSNIDPSVIYDVIISSVVPNLTHTLSSMSIKFFNKKPTFVSSELKLGLNINYDNPKEVGADRIVNAVAVIKLYKIPAIIIDIGTAMTFCIIDEDKNYLGGMILPGIGISSEALFQRTSKLPKIEIIKPEVLISPNTVGAIQSGLYYGYTTMLDGIIEKILENKNWRNDEVSIVATGGFSNLLCSDSRYNIIINRDLTLEGLKIIYDMNN